jgi:CelD/BcsL family acetyltransferase involved in cellulose biosynthesis
MRHLAVNPLERIGVTRKPVVEVHRDLYRGIMDIERIEDTAGFEKLKEEWNELLESSASNCLFLTWEWLYTWWKHLSDGRKLLIIAVRCDGELVGIAPLAVRPRKLTRLLPFRLVEFLGTGSVGSDYLDLIIRRGKEHEALQALAEYLAHGKLMLELAQLKRGTCSAAELASQLRLRNWTHSEAKINICPFINLARHSWESYLAALGSKNRSDIERRLRNLNQQFDVRFEQALSEEKRREALRLLFALHNMRWRERGGSAAFHTPSLLSFHEELSQLALARGWLRLFILWLDGKPAGARYGFRYHRTFYSYQSGFDPSYGKHGVGLIAVLLAIKSAIAEGTEEYDLLAGTEAYKFRLAREARELWRLDLYPPGARGLLYKRVITLRRAAKRMARVFCPNL